MSKSADRDLVLSGLDGSNPLAFLAALGAFRTFIRIASDVPVTMRWHADGTWNPVIAGYPESEPGAVSDQLHAALAGAEQRTEFGIGDDLTLAPDVFRGFAASASAESSPADRRAADFASAYGCDATISATSDKPLIQDTALRTMAGAGHQHFLGFMRNIIQATTAAHLRKALFEPWSYDDSVQNQTLRWDPLDDVRYALRWRDPSGDPVRRKRGNMLGANRLAIEGLALLPTIPTRSGLGTTGFRGRRSSDTFWTWPIWTAPASVDSVRSLLALKALQAESPDREELGLRGIPEVFRSQRITIGKVRNFTAAESV